MTVAVTGRPTNGFTIGGYTKTKEDGDAIEDDRSFRSRFYLFESYFKFMRFSSSTANDPRAG